MQELQKKTDVPNVLSSQIDPALVDVFFQNFDAFATIMRAHPDKPIEPFRPHLERNLLA